MRKLESNRPYGMRTRTYKQICRKRKRLERAIRRESVAALSDPSGHPRKRANQRLTEEKSELRILLDLLEGYC